MYIKHCQIKFSRLTGQSAVFHSLITRRTSYSIPPQCCLPALCFKRRLYCACGRSRHQVRVRLVTARGKNKLPINFFGCSLKSKHSWEKKPLWIAYRISGTSLYLGCFLFSFFHCLSSSFIARTMWDLMLKTVWFSAPAIHSILYILSYSGWFSWRNSSCFRCVYQS